MSANVNNISLVFLSLKFHILCIKVHHVMALHKHLLSVWHISS